MPALLLLIILLFTNNAPAQTPAKTPQISIERKSKELDAIIKKNAKVEVIADGFEWVEGPVWVESRKILLVSDVPENRIYKWTAAKGKELYLEPSGYTQSKPRGAELGSNGLSLNHKGQLVLCHHGDRRIALMNASLDDPKPEFITLADSYNGRKFNSPNDLAIKSNGDIYFTDPPYGLEKGATDPAREIPYQGVYKISKDGTVTLLTDTLTRPNGIAFFPGEKKLLIANSDSLNPHWYIYDVDKNGLLHNGSIFFNGTKAYEKENRTPDGIKIDNQGNVFAAGPGGIWIFNKKGNAIGRIKMNIKTSNCAFANNYKTLFITEDHYLLKVDLR
ncbi:MAG: SMP-30/gluconolactonase/LRE family protein [Bacteroidota bacterium]|nr:SMP-30/gluconolactonase/LRE family protein [Bacteroidota bacterium]